MRIIKEGNYPNGNKMFEKLIFDNGKIIVKLYLSDGDLWIKHLLSKDKIIIFGEYMENNVISNKIYYL